MGLAENTVVSFNRMGGKSFVWFNMINHRSVLLVSGIPYRSYDFYGTLASILRTLKDMDAA